MLEDHVCFMGQQMVDSLLPSTRRYWRNKHGFERFADDPRPLQECIDNERVEAVPEDRDH